MYLVLVGLVFPFGYCGLLTALISTILQFEVNSTSPVSIKLGYWLQGQNVEWSMLFDSQTVSMVIPVIYVSALVQLYSMGYMSSDPFFSKFLGLLLALVSTSLLVRELVCNHQFCSFHSLGICYALGIANAGSVLSNVVVTAPQSALLFT